MTTESPDEIARIDRLVDGELPAQERAELLRRLDAMPDGRGWRRCALAYLEAQAWREAFAPEPAMTRPIRPAQSNQTPWPRLAVAAGWLAAFGLGLAAREWTWPAGSGAKPAPAVAVGESDDAMPPPLSAEPQPPVDPLRRELQGRGYEVDRRRGLLAVGTRDGRPVTIPVERVRLRYVGDHTY